LKNATFDQNQTLHGWCIGGLKQQSTIIDYSYSVCMKCIPSKVPRFTKSAEFGGTNQNKWNPIILSDFRA
jgi:hypothetical protein